MADVTISQQEYKELCKDQARLQILIAFMESEKLISIDEFHSIVGIKKKSEEE